MRIYLVRHGESEGNVDKTLHTTLPDHAIGLTERGHTQARHVGEFFARSIFGYGNGFRVWRSPYLRTRQTCDDMLDAIYTDPGGRGCKPAYGVHESVLLAEQQFGLFDGLSAEQLEEKYPNETAHYDKCARLQGRYFARLPLGESRFDVTLRVHQFFGTIVRDADRHNIQNLIIVTHGTTLRAFVMQWLHLPWEWMEKEPNPKNCAVRLLEGNVDRGYVYEGG